MPARSSPDTRRTGVGFAFLVGATAVVVFHAIVGLSYLVPVTVLFPDLGWEPTRYWLQPVWDEGWYWTIALHGYRLEVPDFRVESNLPFSPGLPLLLRGLSALTGMDPAHVRLPAAAAAFLAACILLARLLDRVEADRGTRRFAVALVAFAPGSMFFLTGYSESLYLPLLLGAILMMLERRFAAASLLSALALHTRSPAIVLVPTLAVAVSLDDRSRVMRRLLLYVPICMLGLAAYMARLWIDVGDPFAFLKGYTSWYRIHESRLDALAMEGPSRAVWIGFTEGVPSMATAGILFAAMPIVLAIERCRVPLVALAFAAFGWLLCLHQAPPIKGYEDVLRWTAVLFPFHLALALLTERLGRLRRPARVVLLAAFAALWAVNVYRFVHVRWVS